jgi:hypothetical protein
MVMHNPSLLAGPRQDRDIRGVSPEDSARGRLSRLMIAPGYLT